MCRKGKPRLGNPLMLAMGIALVTCVGNAEEQTDLFAFIPEGGRSILTRMLEEGTDLSDQLGQTRDGPAWQKAVADDQSEAGIGLDEWQRETLADYLTYATPVADMAALPPDGRDLMLAKCQSCHIVTVVITQARAREAWLGTMNKPSHVGVPLTAAERQQLADYLAVNAGIPIDAVPPELRAGGASY